MAKRTCSVEGCDRPSRARGWCSPHYYRWKKSGSVEGPPVLAYYKWPETLLARMEPQPNGCIHYTGQVNRLGYGRVTKEGTTAQAHRAAYELLVGPIPDGMTVGHKCHDADETCAGGPSCLHRRCVNPEHLALETIGDNVRASSNTPASINAAKTHCPQGHQYDEANTYVNPTTGKRTCRKCQGDADAAYKERCRSGGS